jgi:DNA-binding MarR family transcriptional regulator
VADVEFPVDRAQLEELRQQHIGRLLLRAHRAFSMRANEKLHARGHAGLSLVHTTLFAHLDLAGTRITTLAERVGVSKQAVGSLVQELEQRGYVARSVDPVDRRATLVTLTQAGWQFIQDAHQVKREIEGEYMRVLGEERMQMLREALTLLIEGNDRATRDEDNGESSC